MGSQIHTSKVGCIVKSSSNSITLHGKEKDNQKVFTIFDILKVIFPQILTDACPATEVASKAQLSPSE